MVENVERYGEHWRCLAKGEGDGCSKRNLGFSSPVYLKGSAIVSTGAGTTRRGLMTFIGNGGVGTHQGYTSHLNPSEQARSAGEWPYVQIYRCATQIRYLISDQTRMLSGPSRAYDTGRKEEPKYGLLA